jgi:hypothetical protein
VPHAKCELRSTHAGEALAYSPAAIRVDTGPSGRAEIAALPLGAQVVVRCDAGAAGVAETTIVIDRPVGVVRIIVPGTLRSAGDGTPGPRPATGPVARARVRITVDGAPLRSERLFVLHPGGAREIHTDGLGETLLTRARAGARSAETLWHPSGLEVALDAAWWSAVSDAVRDVALMHAVRSVAVSGLPPGDAALLGLEDVRRGALPCEFREVAGALRARAPAGLYRLTLQGEAITGPEGDLEARSEWSVGPCDLARGAVVTGSMEAGCRGRLSEVVAGKKRFRAYVHAGVDARFTIERVRPGRYVLEVSDQVGREQDQRFRVESRGDFTDLGTIAPSAAREFDFALLDAQGRPFRGDVEVAGLPRCDHGAVTMPVGPDGRVRGRCGDAEAFEVSTGTAFGFASARRFQGGAVIHVPAAQGAGVLTVPSATLRVGQILMLLEDEGVTWCLDLPPLDADTWRMPDRAPERGTVAMAVDDGELHWSAVARTGRGVWTLFDNGAQVDAVPVRPFADATECMVFVTRAGGIDIGPLQWRTSRLLRTVRSTSKITMPAGSACRIVYLKGVEECGSEALEFPE